MVASFCFDWVRLSYSQWIRLDLSIPPSNAIGLTHGIGAS